MIREKVKKDLKKVIDTFWRCDVQEIQLEHPENPEHGDYSSNFALAKFENVKSLMSNVKNPFDLAQKIAESFPKRDYLEKVEAVRPGFINFWLSKEFLVLKLNQIIKEGDNFGSSKLGKGKKVVVEFGQPNTHKLPHVGHFRSYALGESLARLLEFSGFKVFRANYQGDVGLQVAKCLWGYRKKNQESIIKNQESNLQKKIALLQEAYVFGSNMYEESEEAKKEIDELNLKIYQKDKSIYKLWKETRKWSLDYYKLMNKLLGTKYHRQYFESEVAEKGTEIISKNTNKVFEKSRGAIIFPGKKYGLHDRVFLTQKGLPTYEAKDLALIFLKNNDFKYDLSLIATALEQIEYFKVVYKAAERINPKLAKKFVHIPFGLVSLKGGRLSSRKGSIVSIDELLENVKESLISLMEEKDYPKEQIKKIVNGLTVGASKYSILRHTPIKNIVFDIKESVALEGNSGPYLQYTYTRAKSILKKAGGNFQFSIFNFQLKEEELVLLRLLYQFPEVVERAVENYNPSLICNYLFQLAQAFNIFYESSPVLKAEKEETKRLRLALVQAVSQVIKNGLNLLGIVAPDKM